MCDPRWGTVEPVGLRSLRRIRNPRRAATAEQDSAYTECEQAAERDRGEPARNTNQRLSCAGRDSPDRFKRTVRTCWRAAGSMDVIEASLPSDHRQAEDPSMNKQQRPSTLLTTLVVASLSLVATSAYAETSDTRETQTWSSDPRVARSRILPGAPRSPDPRPLRPRRVPGTGRAPSSRRSDYPLLRHLLRIDRLSKQTTWLCGECTAPSSMAARRRAKRWCWSTALAASRSKTSPCRTAPTRASWRPIRLERFSATFPRRTTARSVSPLTVPVWNCSTSPSTTTRSEGWTHLPAPPWSPSANSARTATAATVSLWTGRCSSNCAVQMWRPATTAAAAYRSSTTPGCKSSASLRRRDRASRRTTTASPVSGYWDRKWAS